MSTVEFKVHFSNGTKGRKRLRTGPKPEPPKLEPRVPRVARLMALAIHFDGLIREGVIEDYADLARLGGVSRTRASQIMSLLNLAPDIQEDILSAGLVDQSQPELTERYLRRMAGEPEWSSQRRNWTSDTRTNSKTHSPRT